MRETMARLACAVALAAPMTGLTSWAIAQEAPVIALSNSFYGNTWRRQMVDAFTEQAEAAKAEGLIEDYVVLNGDGSVAQQNSQLAELILRGVDVDRDQRGVRDRAQQHRRAGLRCRHRRRRL